MLLLHCKFSCIVGDRSFSAAAALKHLSPTIQENYSAAAALKLLYCWRQEF